MNEGRFVPEMPERLRMRFSIYARLLSHQRKVARARERIAEFIGRTQHPYVAFSAGKDSACVLHLVREQASGTPAVYFDAQCAYPEVRTLIGRTDNLITFPADEPFLETLQRVGLFAPALERITMQTTVWGPAARLIARYGFDSVAYGLRADESRGRRAHARRNGAVFQYVSGLWGCQPIWDWTYDDVWAFILTTHIPYCGTYDRMWYMPEREQRISYWAGESNRENGRYVWLKRNYPDLYNELRSRIPEISVYA